MRRNILLVEPNYANKYPPIGLMKIARYHRELGDNVRFFKGNLNQLVADLLLERYLPKITDLDSADFQAQDETLRRHIRGRKVASDHIELRDENNRSDVELLLNEAASIFRRKKHAEYPKFDRVYVTTLFTFYWPVTTQTIRFCKNLVNEEKDLLVGGILATLMEKELKKELGIEPMTGLLNVAGQLDPDNPLAQKIIIDDLPLDYSILDEVDYQYPTRSAYFTFMTKGCTRKCAFCSVPVLEPEYQPKVPTIDKFGAIKNQFGEQQNLLLMDNNVLASPFFDEIIDEIKEMGFVRGAKYIEPNQLDIAVEMLRNGFNERGNVRRIHRLLHSITSKLKADDFDTYAAALSEFHLFKLNEVKSENILNAYPTVKEIFEKYRSKRPRTRYVDFNQGTDCRYVTPEKMAKMAEIPIRPLRIAFDHISIKKQYEKAVRLAAENDIRLLSNYILYNFKDKPRDLWERLKINVDLCKELNVEIFSFPMKYIPLFNEEAKSRKHIGDHWNRKFIRAVQSILNVTKGIVAPATKSGSTSFFEEAFGETIEEFEKILYMPENYIVYRKAFRDAGYTQVWWEEFQNVREDESKDLRAFIEKDDFSPEAIAKLELSPESISVLRHYRVPRTAVDQKDDEFKKIKKFYDTLIEKDQFIDLTLTYDFETRAATRSKKSVDKSRKIELT